MMEASRYLFQTLRPALRPLRKESTLFYTQHIARRPLSVSSATPRETSRQDPTPLLRRNLRSNPLGGRLLLARGQLRQNTTSSEAHPPPEEVAGTPASPPRVEGEGSSKIDVPSYDITFTCKPCFHRAAHRISKQGYHKGTVIITCPKCSARHLISDHLRIFRDQSVTIEDILREKGELFKKGRMDPNGDVELWESTEGAETFSERRHSPSQKPSPAGKPPEDSARNALTKEQRLEELAKGYE